MLEFVKKNPASIQKPGFVKNIGAA
jgi:hypothetical protein